MRSDMMLRPNRSPARTVDRWLIVEGRRSIFTPPKENYPAILAALRSDCSPLERNELQKFSPAGNATVFEPSRRSISSHTAKQ